jgi:hypothetical protein
MRILLLFFLPLFLLAEDPLETAGYIFDRYPSTYFPTPRHSLANVTEYTLELADGSLWKIGAYDQAKALRWEISTPLTITQNNRWFSSHNYRIINEMDGSSVEATPCPDSLSRFIQKTDLHSLSLSDGTRWEISSLDEEILKTWAPHDYLVIGTNSSSNFWDQTIEVLLMNANKKNFVRAKQL